MKLGKNTSRHPAVVDLLGGAPTPSPVQPLMRLHPAMRGTVHWLHPQ